MNIVHETLSVPRYGISFPPLLLSLPVVIVSFDTIASYVYTCFIHNNTTSSPAFSTHTRACPSRFISISFFVCFNRNKTHTHTQQQQRRRQQRPYYKVVEETKKYHIPTKERIIFQFEISFVGGCTFISFFNFSIFFKFQLKKAKERKADCKR